MAIPNFSENQIETLAREFADARTHTQFSDIFRRIGLDALEAGQGPKWLRIRDALLRRQERDRCGNNVGTFIEATMDPVNFVSEPQRFDSLREGVNTILAFSGFALGTNGRLVAVPKSNTLDEALERAGRL